jgi:hypothetical protein
MDISCAVDDGGWCSVLAPCVSGGLKMYPNRRFENAAEKRFLKAVIGINFGGQWLLCI